MATSRLVLAAAMVTTHPALTASSTKVCSSTEDSPMQKSERSTRMPSPLRTQVQTAGLLRVTAVVENSSPVRVTAHEGFRIRLRPSALTPTSTTAGVRRVRFSISGLMVLLHRATMTRWPSYLEQVWVKVISSVSPSECVTMVVGTGSVTNPETEALDT